MPDSCEDDSMRNLSKEVVLKVGVVRVGYRSNIGRQSDRIKGDEFRNRDVVFESSKSA
jgi:hypothetical protein